MSAWGKNDNATGNNKPKYANTANTYGVSATEKANTSGIGSKLTHSGWVKITKFTGGVESVVLVNPGDGYTANGFLTFAGGGTGANASYTVNTTSNTIVTVTLNAKGVYNTAPTVSASGGANATFTVTMGGKVGRTQNEVLVAMGGIVGDDSNDNGILPGV